jgi:hypothetical protein
VQLPPESQVPPAQVLSQQRSGSPPFKAQNPDEHENAEPPTAFALHTVPFVSSVEQMSVLSSQNLPSAEQSEFEVHPVQTLLMHRLLRQLPSATHACPFARPAHTPLPLHVPPEHAT